MASNLNRLDDAMDGFACAYNGYVFGPTADTTNFSVRPVKDPAGRTTAYSTYSITVQETIAAFSNAETTDAYVEDAIARLSPNAGQLVYTGRGFGSLAINIIDLRDVMWGPTTKNISCTPTGAGQAVLLSWTVEFCIPNCDDALYKGILFFNYSVDFAIDRQGYTTRTYNSELQLAATKKSVNNRDLPSCADDYREQTVPKLPIGFRPESQNFALSLDKQNLKTTVVHVQMPFYAPPPGCVEAAFDESWNTQGSFLKWVVSFNATYDIDRDAGNPKQAVQAYIATVRKRLDTPRRDMKNGDGVFVALPAAVRGNPTFFIPLSASVSDPNVYGRQQVKISSTMLVTSGVGLSAVLENGGLWTRINDKNSRENWEIWQASLPNTLGARGHALLALKASDDSIVDLCGPSPLSSTIGGRTNPPTGTTGTPTGGFPGGLPGLVGITGSLTGILRETFPAPPPESSWLFLRMALETAAASGRVIGTTLPGNPLEMGNSQPLPAWDYNNDVPGGVPSGGPFPPLKNQFESQGNSQSQSSVPTGTFIQQRVKPTLYVTLSGTGLRAGYGIPVPEIIQINGKKPLLIGTPYFKQWVVYESLSCPIIKAEWSLTYAFVDDGPTGSGIPNNAPIPVPPNALYA